MKILVTGATGFVGRYVLQQLVELKEYEIIATSKNEEKVKSFPWFNKVKYIPCDLNKEEDNYYAFFNKPDLLIHLAWEGLPNYKELFQFERNLFANYNFLKAMITNGLSSLSIIGTCLEYGMINGCLSEDLNTNPNTSYGLAKDTLRRFIEELRKFYHFNFKWIRLFYMYGKGQNPNSLLPQLKRALNNDEKIFNMSLGDQLRDYLHIKKVAEYIVKISLQNEINGIINCCNGKPISIRNVVENYIEKKGKSIKLNLGFYPYLDYEPMAFWGDNTKLESIIKKK